MNQRGTIFDPVKMDPFTRRQFIKTAAISALGALILQQKALAYEAGASARMVSVFGIVDVAQSLADRDITPNVYWFDNNRRLGSTHMGTNALVSKVKPGDVINWVVAGLEVETDLRISDIRGSIVPVVKPMLDPASPFSAWKGEVPVGVRGAYAYTVDILLEDIVFPMTTLLSLDVI